MCHCLGLDFSVGSKQGSVWLIQPAISRFPTACVLLRMQQMLVDLTRTSMYSSYRNRLCADGNPNIRVAYPSSCVYVSSLET